MNKSLYTKIKKMNSVFAIIITSSLQHKYNNHVFAVQLLQNLLHFEVQNVEVMNKQFCHNIKKKILIKHFKYILG